MKTKAIFRPFLVVCACYALLASGILAAGDPVPSAKDDLPRLVDLGADKCVPCKLMKPILDDLTKDYADQFEVEFIDVWKKPEEGEKYGIKLIPTQIFIGADGKELARHEGFFAKKDILAKWEELGVELKEPAAPKRS
jgi:thioredoxin 1